MKTKFDMGRLLATPGALAALESAGESPAKFLDRHVTGDWGDVCSADGRLNDQSLLDGSRLLSAYQTAAGVKIWIITEATDSNDQRPATTILLPEEY